MRGLARLAGVNVAVLLAGLVLAELVFGSWFRGDSLGGISVKTNIDKSLDVHAVYGRVEPVHYSRDRWGLRGGSTTPAEIDVVAIGGSTTNEYFIDDAETWTAVLQRDLAADGRRLTVANAGIDGQSSFGHLLALEQWLSRVEGLKPRWVILFVGVNDAGGTTDNTPLESPSGHDRIRNPDPWRRAGNWIGNNSALYRLWRTGAGVVRARRAQLIHGSIDPAAVRWEPVEQGVLDAAVAAVARPPLEAYAGRLRRLAANIRIWGAEPIFVTQHKGSYRRSPGNGVLLAAGPDFRDGFALHDYAAMTAVNAVTMDTCRAVAAICIDFGGEVEVRPGDFYDYAHTTPQGSARIGHFLHDRLRPILR